MPTSWIHLNLLNERECCKLVFSKNDKDFKLVIALELMILIRK